MRYVLLFFGLLFSYAAHAEDDVERMTVSYVLDVFADKGERQVETKLNVAYYLAGIRDHLWWQCRYEVTVPVLFRGALFRLRAFEMTSSKPEFEAFKDKTPFGDMVFLSLHNNDFYGQPPPCSSKK